VIEGVEVTTLRRIPDARGDILHMLKSSDSVFVGFGEVYFSFLKPRTVKAWRRHLASTSQIAVPIGGVRLLIADRRTSSSTEGLIMDLEVGEHNYCLITIPPMLWYAFEATVEVDSMIVNCASSPHDPTLVDRREQSDAEFPVVWKH